MINVFKDGVLSNCAEKDLGDFPAVLQDAQMGSARDGTDRFYPILFDPAAELGAAADELPTLRPELDMAQFDALMAAGHQDLKRS